MAEKATHAILIRDIGGDHWECLCGGWKFDADEMLTTEEVREISLFWTYHHVLGGR